MFQSVTLGTSPIPQSSKNKFGLVKVLVHFNVYWPKLLTKYLFMVIRANNRYGQCHRLMFMWVYWGGGGGGR